MIKITFPDGNVKEFAKGTTAYQIAESISPRLAADSLAASVNGATVDLNRAIEEDASIKFYKWDDPEGKHAFWHTSSHLLAEALEALYPGIKFGIGPAIENGFYYDVDSPVPITEADLETIEKKMIELSRNKEQLIRTEVSKADALKNFTEKGDPYKVELIRDLEDGTISFYTNGAFTDLCRGPHLPNTGLIKAIKLTSVAGAYWRGNEKNKMLTRIYGISFPKKSMLDEYLAMMEEAKKRDHRKLGKELELFCFSQRVGQGLPLWLPKGAALRDRLEQFLRGVQKEYGYQQVITPHIGNKELYVTSGHYAKYGKDSFQPIHTPIEGEEYLLKPMNCPHHCEIYRSKPRSYKELPVRLAEFGTVYRYEQSGELHGLTRVRGFTQDDAHLFVRPDQLLEEFERVIDIVLYIFKTLKFDNYTAQISLRDPNNKEKYIGSDENWEKAESAIMQAAKEKGLTTVVELGEAAFYGPKLDFMVRDAIGRKWQLGTIPVDYNLPGEFAFREAVVDLTQFDDFEEVASQFYESSLVPYTYRGGVYALPETMDFTVMIYRQDVMRELGIDLPETWTDLYQRVLPRLYENNMSFSLPVDTSVSSNSPGALRGFTMLLLQMGGEYYNGDGESSALDTPEAYKAFKFWTDMYANYGIDAESNFFTRIRTGTMPIGISNYTGYLQLLTSAPELYGRWSIAPVPGTVQADGTVSHAVGTTASTAGVILSQSDKQEAAWTFLKWWMSAETQTRYGRELEAILGTGARWNTANVESFFSLPWDARHAQIIKAQMESAREQMIVPGGYFTGRHIINAWNSVVVNNKDARDMLEKAVKDINKELNNKRKEFGLDN